MNEIAEILFAGKPYLFSRVESLLNEHIPYNLIFKINNASYTLIHLAVLRDAKVLEKILEYKPKLDQLIDMPPGIHNPCSSVFVTPLMLAILSGKIENAYLLIKAGADINQFCRTSGHTATSLAICCQKWKLAEELIDLGGVYELQEKKGDFSILERITQLQSTPKSLKNKIFSFNKFPSLEKLYPGKEYEEFVWRIIPSSLFNKLKGEENILNILEFKGKRVANIVMNKVFKECQINFSFLSFYYILKDIGFNYDLFCNLLNHVKITNYYSWNEGEIDFINRTINYLLLHYTEKQVVEMLKNTYQEGDDDLHLMNGFWQDLFFMFYRLEQSEKKISKYLPKKPKNLTKIHDYMAFLMAKEDQANFNLNQEELDLKIGNLLFKNFKIFIPKTNHDLIGVGLGMHICVGNGVYANKILKKESEILIIMSSKEQYCVEIDYQSKEIIDMKGRFNEEADAGLFVELQSFLNHALWWQGRCGF